jgi:RNA polymerase sigma-70 factor (ECF subfamily)
MCITSRELDGVITKLARQHTAMLVRIAGTEGLLPTEALDAVQDAFATFIRRCDAGELSQHDEEARALLITMTRNASRNMRRRRQRAEELQRTRELDRQVDSPCPETMAISAEDRSRLAVCVRELEETRRAVVTLRVLEEVSGPEVARQLGLTAGHVAVLLHRAKGDLRACMAR